MEEVKKLVTEKDEMEAEIIGLQKYLGEQGKKRI